MENIKREIINAIYENGENLITGPILQEVLLDMVDDSNEKDSQLSQSLNDGITSLSESVAQSIADIPTPDLSEYATTQSVEDSIAALSESVSQSIADIPAPDLSEYAKTVDVEDLVNETSASVKSWVEAKHYLTTASLSGSVTEETVGFMIGDATASVKEWVEDKGYATEDWVQSQGYLTEHQDISGLATTESVTSLSESVAQDFANLNIPDVSGLATTESVTALSESVAESIASIPQPDLSEYATTESVNQLSESVAQSIADIPQPDLSGYLTTESYQIDSASFDQRIDDLIVSGGAVDPTQFAAVSESVNEIIDTYATTESLNQVSESVASDITALSESIAAITGSDLSGYATTASVTALSESFHLTEDSLQGQISILSEDFTTLATTESVNSLSESVAGYEIDTLWGAVNATEEAGVITWDEESEEYVGIEVATAEDLTLLSESVANDFNILSDSDADNNPIADFLENAGLAIRVQDPEVGGYEYTLTPVSSLSESVAQDVADLSASIAAITGSGEPVDLSGYATTASVNSLSESVAQDIAGLSASIADITGSTPDLSNYVTYSNLTSSYSTSSSVLDASNGRVQKMELSSNGTLDLSSLEEGDKVSVFVKNAANVPVTVFVPGTLESLPVVYNGEENSGSLVVDEWGWMEITRLADAVYVNASVVLPDYSQFATSASVTAVSESVVALSESINSTVTSLSESIDSTIIALSESVSQSISEITGSSGSGSADLSGYATTASLYDVHTVTASLDPDSGETRFEIDWSYPNYLFITTEEVEDYAYIRPTTEPKDGKTYTFMIRPYGGDYPIVLPLEFRWGEGENEFSAVKVNNEDMPGDLEMRDHVALQLTYYKGGLNQETGIEVPNEMYVNFVKNVQNPEDTLLDYQLIREEYDEEEDWWHKVRNVPTYAEMSLSISASIAEITGSGGGADTQLRNFLFGTGSLLTDGTIYPSASSNWVWEVSESRTFPLGAELGEGKSIQVIVHNVGSEDVDVTFNDEYWGPYSVVNGILGSGSFSIPTGEYGDVVATQIGDKIYFRTSIDVSNVVVDLSGYATTESVNLLSESVAEDVTELSASIVSVETSVPTYAEMSESIAEGMEEVIRYIGPTGSVNFWRAGSGSTSLEAQSATADGRMSLAYGERTYASGEWAHAEGAWTHASGAYSHAEGYETHAGGDGSHAEGTHTVAEGYISHAEGYYTRAEGRHSHAEGSGTSASGDYSHAEGTGSIALGNCSHAQGSYTIADSACSFAQGRSTRTTNFCEVALGKNNSSASSQIFSVGVGHGSSLTDGTKNAISITTGSGAVPSASVFIYGVGGYDGTNPNPGTNDLASVLSNISGSSFIVENWTFVLEDSSSVTKNVVTSL